MEESAVQKPKFSEVLDKFVYTVGSAVSWLSVALILAIMVQVILRYFFGKSVVIVEEVQWHLYGIMIIMAISYTLTLNKHIRLDVFHCRFSLKSKAKVDFFGILFFLLPMSLYLLDQSLNVVSDSYRVNEMSDSPLGLCCRWAFKAFMPIGLSLLTLASIARLISMASQWKQGDTEPGEACHVPEPADESA